VALMSLPHYNFVCPPYCYRNVGNYEVGLRIWCGLQCHNFHIKFHQNPTSGSRVEKCGRRDRYFLYALGLCTSCEERVIIMFRGVDNNYICILLFVQ
jgi:hypothetical protein